METRILLSSSQFDRDGDGEVSGEGRRGPHPQKL